MFNAVLEALDLSQITGNLFNNNANTSAGNVLVRDCKLSATTAIATLT